MLGDWLLRTCYLVPELFYLRNEARMYKKLTYSLLLIVFAAALGALLGGAAMLLKGTVWQGMAFSVAVFTGMGVYAAYEYVWKA